MQSNRVWIAVLLATSVFVSSSVKAQESGPLNTVSWQRANDLVKKLTLDEKLQFLLSKYPSNADPGRRRRLHRGRDQVSRCTQN
jgi:beta-glucosidase